MKLEQILEFLPKTVSLTYVDNNDNLDHFLPELEQCIQSNSLEFLDEKLDDAFQEQSHESYKEILKTLKNDLIEKTSLKKSKVKELLEIYEDEIKDEIYQRDDSNVIKDLFRNTSNPVMFFDTGYEMPCDSWRWNKRELEEEMRKIKNVLRIRANHDFDNNIIEMIQCASYGGRLVVYFRISPDELLLMSNKENNYWEPNQIIFENMTIAVIDINGGSGWYAELIGHKCKFEFNRTNLFIDKNIKYNFTYSVCEMSSDWCDNTKVSFAKGKALKKVEDSSINFYQARELRYKKTYASGSCTSGDMDMHRHRSVTYINNYPCGNKCTDCGTFWID